MQDLFPLLGLALAIYSVIWLVRHYIPTAAPVRAIIAVMIVMALCLWIFGGNHVQLIPPRGR